MGVDLVDGRRGALSPSSGSNVADSRGTPQWMADRIPRLERAVSTSVRLISDAQAVAVDVTASLSQIQANTDLDAAALTAVDIPADARPVTLEQLRAAGASARRGV
jgi:hypothetical protein